MPKPLIAALLGQFLTVALLAIVPAANEAGGVKSPPAKNRFVGVQACKDCHHKNYISWKKSGHRTTFKRLNLNTRKNPQCLKCHATGYGRETGFVNLEKTPQHATVGCEGCHGPGGLHVDLMERKPDPATVKDFKIPAPRKESCVECHKFHRHH